MLNGQLDLSEIFIEAVREEEDMLMKNLTSTPNPQGKHFHLFGLQGKGRVGVRYAYVFIWPLPKPDPHFALSLHLALQLQASYLDQLVVQLSIREAAWESL